MARLGGVLQVVLALWSRLGGRMGPFRTDLGTLGSRTGGVDPTERSAGRCGEWGGRPWKTGKHQPDNQTNTGILTRPCRAGTVADN